MRPHTELVHPRDLIWHPGELPRSEGKARQRNLSYDEELGAASTLVEFETAWSRPAGYHASDTEWFVLEGNLTLGDQHLSEGAYWRAPAGLAIPQVDVKPGTRVLIFREYGDHGFSRSEQDSNDFILMGGNTASEERGTLTIVETKQMDWVQNSPDRGKTQKYLKHKDLYHDDSPADRDRGFHTFLCWAPPDWSDGRLMHHPCFEEAYCLAGDMTYNFGEISPGAYFYRPARVKHGSFMANSEVGTQWIFRLDGDLINWVTLNAEVSTSGEAVNYDPDDDSESPILAGIPVRSRSIGPWDGQGR